MKTPFSFKGKGVISIADFSKSDIISVLKVAGDIEKGKVQKSLFEGVLMATCFFEPSTRTRLSFETAMKRLGGNVIGFADPNVTSAKKGESLSDTMKIIGQYADVIALRHPLDGAARLASLATDTPIINAGDGSNQHPTQTLIDLYTIINSQKKIDGLTVGFVGDLKYGRTVHSLLQALVHFDVRIYCIAPQLLQLPDHYCNELKSNYIKFSFHESFNGLLEKMDVVYMTRVQQERFSDSAEYERVKNIYSLSADDLKNVKKNLAILHPLPRLGEIQTSVDATPHAWYFRQAKNGVAVRQAVLALVLEKIE